MRRFRAGEWFIFTSILPFASSYEMSGMGGGVKSQAIVGFRSSSPACIAACTLRSLVVLNMIVLIVKNNAGSNAAAVLGKLLCMDFFPNGELGKNRASVTAGINAR